MIIAKNALVTLEASEAIMVSQPLFGYPIQWQNENYIVAIKYGQTGFLSWQAVELEFSPACFGGH